MDVQVQNGRADQRGQVAANQPSTKTHVRSVVAPPVDILENDNEFLLIADLPGATTRGLSLQVEHGVLTLNAEGVRSTGAVLLRELAEADYRLSFRLPRGVDANGIRAVLKDGVLTVTAPKAEPARTRKIPVSG